jgi:hypothetical protein
MRRAAKKDSNQNPIVRELIQAGYSVLDLSKVGGGAIDILVGGIDRHTGERRAWPMEIKTKKGKLNAIQEEWHAAWRGPVHVVRTVEEALAIVGVGL